MPKKKGGKKGKKGKKVAEPEHVLFVVRTSYDVDWTALSLKQRDLTQTATLDGLSGTLGIEGLELQRKIASAKHVRRNCPTYIVCKFSRALCFTA